MLRFPNIRLHVHDLFMAEGLSGSEAIAHCAGEIGIIKPEAVLKTIVSDSDGTCHCLATAKNVLSSHFADRPNPMPVAVDIEEVWSTVEERVVKVGTTSPCYMHAAALMDIMIQQISCYPDA